MSVSSARVSPSTTANIGQLCDERDAFMRSKKKVRPWDEDVDDTEKEREPSNITKESNFSYKDKLLNLFGEAIPDKLNVEAIQEMAKLNISKDKPSTEITMTADHGLSIPLEDTEWNSWATPWRNTLVTKLLGKKVSFRTLESYLQRKWARKGKIQIVDMADGFHLIYFSSQEDYNFALFEGPWMIADHYYLIVQRWQPLFLQNAAISSKVAVWIRIPKLPLELYNTVFLCRIGSAMGITLKIDKQTSIHCRGKYA
jgi:hypothetical protein